ncbi:MAG: hypothetical protein KGK11_07760 [Sphingomonadales bacterium]|nr:hypothetical protein [Sphingomonadales bacterium]
MTDARRYAGYAAAGTTMPIDANTDVVFVQYGSVTMSLWTRLSTLSASEEAVLTGIYLANLNMLEAAVPLAGDNLDTTSAAVWTHNPQEVRDRLALFNQWALRMCAFLGLAPGPGLQTGPAAALVRG